MSAGRIAARYAFLRALARIFGEVYTFVYGFHFLLPNLSTTCNSRGCPSSRPSSRERDKGMYCPKKCAPLAVLIAAVSVLAPVNARPQRVGF